jgi:leucyl/phenylalanyl-tRNA--protein transferase
MPLYVLDKDIIFPPAEHADEDGLLAIGGDLSMERLLEAFPMVRK